MFWAWQTSSTDQVQVLSCTLDSWMVTIDVAVQGPEAEHEGDTAHPASLDGCAERRCLEGMAMSFSKDN